MRMLLPKLIAGLWLVWLAYWLIAARGVKKPVVTESRRARLAYAMPSLAGLWLLGGNAPRWLDARFLPPGRPLAWLGLVLLAGGLGWSVWARRWLGAEWSGRVSLKQDHVLVRGGPYRFTRHPIYTGLLVALAGTALALGRWRGLAGVALAWLAFRIKSRSEERLLETKFPEEYPRFRAEAPGLLPRLLPWPRRQPGRGTSQPDP